MASQIQTAICDIPHCALLAFLVYYHSSGQSCGKDRTRPLKHNNPIMTIDGNNNNNLPFSAKFTPKKKNFIMFRFTAGAGVLVVT